MLSDVGSERNAFKQSQPCILDLKPEIKVASVSTENIALANILIIGIISYGCMTLDQHFSFEESWYVLFHAQNGQQCCIVY